MKLLRVGNGRYAFQMAPRERELFAIILGLYPVIPSAHQPLSKSSMPDKANQRLLDEALAEQRKENRKLVENLLTDPGRFRETAGAIEMTLTAAEMEWVLQVLNDVRVGNWILLGSPEEPQQFSPQSESARFVMAMDLACMFQSYFLDAIRRNS